MIPTAELINIAKERLTDAEILLDASRYDGAVYLCGYAVEIALKHKICQSLNWLGFPSTNKEFEKYKSLKTHDLDVLLTFTGIEVALKTNYFAEWSTIRKWDPEARYNPIGAISKEEANLIIDSAKTLIKIL